MASSTIRIVGTVGGAWIDSYITRAASGAINQEISLAAAKAGTLTTIYDPNNALVTFESGHGFQQNDMLDLYWEGGRRYNVIAGLPAGDIVPVSSGQGDSWPDPATAITAQKQIVVDTDFLGDLLVMLGLRCSQRGHLGFFNGGSIEKSADLVAGELWPWWSDGPHANPLAGKTITQIKVSQASLVAATMRVGVLYNSSG